MKWLRKLFKKKRNVLWEKREDEVEFKVNGAGIVRFSTDTLRCTGIPRIYGFSIGVSWGRYGYTGGVMPRSEALKLAKHIIKVLKNGSTTKEIQYYKRKTD